MGASECELSMTLGKVPHSFVLKRFCPDDTHWDALNDLLFDAQSMQHTVQFGLPAAPASGEMATTSAPLARG